MVHLRRGGRYDRIIYQDEYRHVKPDMHPRFFYEKAVVSGGKSFNLPLINELERNLNMTGSHKADKLLRIVDMKMAEDAKPFFEQAVKAYQAGGHATALELYEQGLAIFPKNASALTIAGFLHLNNRRYGKARDYFSRAIEHDSNEANAYYGLGLLSNLKPHTGTSQGHSKDFMKERQDAIFAAKKLIFTNRHFNQGQYPSIPDSAAHMVHMWYTWNTLPASSLA